MSLCRTFFATLPLSPAKEPYMSQTSLHFAAEGKCRADFGEGRKQEKQIVPVPRVCLPPRIRFWSLAPFWTAPISPERALNLRQNMIAEMTFAEEYIFKVIPVSLVSLPPRTRFWSLAPSLKAPLFSRGSVIHIYMCTHLCACLFACMYACVFSWHFFQDNFFVLVLWTYIYIYTSVCVCMQVCIRVFMMLNSCIIFQKPSFFPRLCFMHIYIYIYVCIHVCMYVCMYV